MSELWSLLFPFFIGVIVGVALLWSWRIDTCHENKRLLKENTVYKKKLHAAGEKIVSLEAELERKKTERDWERNAGLY